MKSQNIDSVKISCYVIILVLLSIIWFRSCYNPKPQILTVKTPKIKGVFNPKKPKTIPFEMAKERPSNTADNTKNTLSSLERSYIQMAKENEKLKKDFAKANDSIKKIQFAKAVQLSKFTSTFENDTIKIDIDGLVQGEVKEVTPKYVIKERKTQIQVKAREAVFRLLGGVEVGGTTQLNNFVAKGNLIFQNRKGNTTSISYDTNKNIWIGKNWSIFSVKR